MRVVMKMGFIVVVSVIGVGVVGLVYGVIEVY